MRTPSIPPVTRACIFALSFLSLLVFVLRLNSYYKLLALAKAPQIQPETDERPIPRPILPVFRDIVVPYITLIPSLSAIYPWVIATTSFVETSVLGFVATGLTLIYGGRYCEHVWSSKELARFLVLVGVLANIAAAATAVTQFSFANTIPTHFVNVKKEGDAASSLQPVSSEFYLLQSINGGIAFQLAFLVALKQLVPEHSIVLFRGLFSMKVKHLVMPALILYTLIGAFYFYDFPFIAQVWTGFFVSWIYLRFYRFTYVDSILPTSSNAGANPSEPTLKAAPGKTRIRGDASEVFSLANFFYPGVIRDLIQRISTIVFSVFVSLKICTPFGANEVEQSNLRASVRANGGSVNRTTAPTGRSLEEIEAERRRAVALKALEQKLSDKGGR